MGDQHAVPQRATAWLQENVESVSPGDLPILDECPICLDTYSTEQAVRIKLKDCGHVFGITCLVALFTSNANLEKTCPLCRTVWMSAPAPRARNPARAAGRPPRAVNGNAFLEAVQAEMEEENRQQHGDQLRLAVLDDRIRQARERQNGRSASGLRPPSREAQAVINLIDSDEEEVTQESFNAFSRDIHDIRTRARNTQLSRKQRKEEKARKENEDDFPLRTIGRVETVKSRLKKANTNEENKQNQQSQQSQLGQQGQQMPGQSLLSDWGPCRRIPIEEMIQRNWATAAQGSNQNGGQTALPSLFRAPRPFPSSTNPFTSSRPSAPASSPPNPQPVPARPNPFLSPSPDSDADAGASRAQKERLDQREKELKELEKNLLARERGLNERDRALFQREQRIAQRETVEMRSAELMQRQLNEMEEMIARHREEMRRE
ncbi:hypothetical protein N0V90_004687 [Kalmusia sp. IMI 367209]|nr:hypothetical protein N0V90_004687 [Kalmusia sp. IMI 367209]